VQSSFICHKVNDDDDDDDNDNNDDDNNNNNNNIHLPIFKNICNLPV
jgi:hypothetical protein